MPRVVERYHRDGDKIIDGATGEVWIVTPASTSEESRTMPQNEPLPADFMPLLPEPKEQPPLALSVDLAREIAERWNLSASHWDVTYRFTTQGESVRLDRAEATPQPLAAMIDAGVRPLADALLRVRAWELEEPNERLPIEIYDAVQAALKAAGAE